MDFLRKIRASSIFAAVLLILFGAVLCCKAFVGAMFTTIIYIIAGILIGIGVFELVIYFTSKENERHKNSMAIGVAEILVGAFAISQYSTVINILSYILVIFVVIDGVTSLESSLKLKKANSKGWIVNLIISIILIVAGCVFMFFPQQLLENLAMCVGILLIIDGIVDIVMIARISKVVKKEQATYQNEMDIQNGNVFVVNNDQ